MLAKSIHATATLKPIKRSKSPGRRTPLGNLQRSPDSLAVGEGNIPSQKTNPVDYLRFAFRPSSLRLRPFGSRHFRGTHNVVDRLSPMPLCTHVGLHLIQSRVTGWGCTSSSKQNSWFRRRSLSQSLGLVCGKTRPNTAKAHIHQSKEIYHNTKYTQ